MKPGAFLLVLRPTEGGFEALLQCRAEHMRDAGTWGLIGGELDPMERWLYTSAGVADDLRCRVLRRAALREALEEMGGASEMPQTQILFEPMCVQVSSDGQAVRLPRSSGAWPVPAGLAFFELDAQRSRCLRVGYMDTFVFVYVAWAPWRRRSCGGRSGTARSSARSGRRSRDYHGGGVHTHGLEYTLMHVDWRLFRWALAILCSTLIVELIQSPLRFYKSLHHISILVAACLMSGIHWISAFDLLLFASGPLLQMSFEAFNGLGWFILSYHYMRPTKNNSKLLRGTMIYMTTFSTLSHASLVVLYCCTFHRFQAWAPQAVLLLLQLCLLCENVYTVCKVRRLSQENFKRLPSQQSSMALPSLLGVCGAEARVKKMSTV